MMKNYKVPSKASVFHGTLGILDKFIKSGYGTENNGCREQDVNICLESPMLGMMGYVFTFSGKLNFNMCYNESYHSAKQAEDFLMAWKTNLEDKLGIETREMFIGKDRDYAYLNIIGVLEFPAFFSFTNLSINFSKLVT